MIDRAVLYPIKRNAPIAPTSPATALFRRDLTYGETSLDVGDLQRVLKVIEPVTGYYGELTRKTVLNFQIQYNLISWWEKIFLRGKRVGPKTRAKLNELFGNGGGIN